MASDTMLTEGSNPKTRSIKGRAASYIQTPVYWYPTIPRVLMIVVPLQLIAIVKIPGITSSGAYWLSVGVTLPFVSWSLVYWKVYQSVFVTGRPEKGPLSNSEWKSFTFRGWGEESLKAFILESDSDSKDLIIYLHGYNSSMPRGESRALQFYEMGMNVISLDQRGFGNQGQRKDWTLLKAVADIEGLLECAPRVLEFTPNRLWIYGHSMGGFLTMRLSSHPSGWWEEALKGIILESPVASFPRIIDMNLPGRTIMAKPWVRHILRREYERIHPDLEVRYATSELPFSGVPIVPVLVIQAENDETLGDAHFDLVKKHLSHISEIHVVDMPHTSQVDSSERRAIVDVWMKHQLA